MPANPLPPSDPAKRIFHYTNAAGLLGILQSQTIWATDTNCLNDTKEVIGSIDGLINRFEKRIKDINAEPKDVVQSNPPESPAIRRSVANEALKYLKEVKTGVTYPGTSQISVFVASLSANGDSIPLWDRYIGKRVEGYAVGFKPEALDQIRMTPNDKDEQYSVYFPRPRAVLRKIAYGEPSLDQLDAVVDRMIPPVIAGMDDRGSSVMQAGSQVLGALAVIKTAHWESEEEWRTIFVRNSREPELPPLKFRADPSGHLGIIPYVEIPLADALNESRLADAIDSIVLSPYGVPFDVREHGLRMKLDSLGLQHVEIWRSESSAR